MTGVAPGWYKDPADPATQRYWDGEGWIGAALPADSEPPPGPPPVEETPSNGQPAPTSPAVPAPSAAPAATTSPPAALPTSPASPHAEPAAPPHAEPAVPPPMQAPAPWPAPSHWAPAAPDAPPAGPPPGPATQPQGASAGTPGLPHPPYPYPYLVRVPPPRPHGHLLATPGARLVARLIDIAVLAVLSLLVNGWFIWQYAVEIAPTVEAWQRFIRQQTTETPGQASSRAMYLQLVIILITAALWLAYEVPAVANTGQTFGKRVLGIRVVRLEEAGPIGFGRSLRRWNTIGLPTLLWPCWGIGFLLQFVDAVYLLVDRPLMQSLHDKSARTVVVRTDGAPGEAGAAGGGPAPGGDDRTTNGGTA